MGNVSSGLGPVAEDILSEVGDLKPVVGLTESTPRPEGILPEVGEIQIPEGNIPDLATLPASPKVSLASSLGFGRR